MECIEYRKGLISYMTVTSVVIRREGSVMQHPLQFDENKPINSKRYGRMLWILLTNCVFAVLCLPLWITLRLLDRRFQRAYQNRMANHNKGAQCD
jgi:hypothetical protein